MHTVEIRCIQGSNIGVRLMELRVWLDNHKCETSRFDYARRGGEAVISLDFGVPEQAYSFAAAFDGCVSKATLLTALVG